MQSTAINLALLILCTQHTNDVICFSTIHLNYLIRKELCKFLFDGIETLKNVVPVMTRFFSSLLTIHFVLWKIVSSPIVLGVIADNHLTILIMKSFTIHSQRIENHMTNHITINRACFCHVQMHHNICNTNLVHIN